MFADWRSTSRAEDITEDQQSRQAPVEQTGSRDKQNRPELEKISSAETTREDMRSRTAAKKTEYSRAEQRLPAKRTISKNFEKIVWDQQSKSKTMEA